MPLRLPPAPRQDSLRLSDGRRLAWREWGAARRCARAVLYRRRNERRTRSGRRYSDRRPGPPARRRPPRTRCIRSARAEDAFELGARHRRTDGRTGTGKPRHHWLFPGSPLCPGAGRREACACRCAGFGPGRSEPSHNPAPAASRRRRNGRGRECRSHRFRTTDCRRGFGGVAVEPDPRHERRLRPRDLRSRAPSSIAIA